MCVLDRDPYQEVGLGPEKGKKVISHLEIRQSYELKKKRDTSQDQVQERRTRREQATRSLLLDLNPDPEVDLGQEKGEKLIPAVGHYEMRHSHEQKTKIEASPDPVLERRSARDLRFLFLLLVPNPDQEAGLGRGKGEKLTVVSHHEMKQSHVRKIIKIIGLH